MSVTVVAVPLALQVVMAVVPAIAAVGTVVASKIEEKTQNSSAANNLSNICEDECEVKYITEANFLEKTFQTPFMDKNILIKTLEEHGISVKVEDYGKIIGTISTYTLEFTRNNETEPYNVVISYLEKDNAEEKVNDLNAEYSLNVQEESYLSIIEKLKENNMELESEEVLEDDTIVLTINLEE